MKLLVIVVVLCCSFVAEAQRGKGFTKPQAQKSSSAAQLEVKEAPSNSIANKGLPICLLLLFIQSQ